MRFKLFVVCALACGFMAYVLANENFSAEEVEFDDQIVNAVPLEQPKAQPKPKPQAETFDVPKATPDPKKVVVVNSTPSPKPSVLTTQKPTQKVGTGGQRMIPVVHIDSRGTDDVLTVAGLKPQAMSGALIMPNDYLGELYDVDNSGYNWGECSVFSVPALIQLT